MTQTDPTSQKNDSPKTLSARAVPKRLDCGPDYVGKLCRTGKMAGQRVDGAWLVSEESVRRYQGARELARKARSESLSSLRRRENEQFRKLVNPPLREALRKISPKTLSARAVAKRLDCGPDYVGKLCRNGKLAGQRVDGAWLVSEESVRRYQGARELARKARSESLSSLRRREN